MVKCECPSTELKVQEHRMVHSLPCGQYFQLKTMVVIDMLMAITREIFGYMDLRQ